MNFRFAVLTLACAAAFAACGGSGGSYGGPPPGPTPTPTPTPTPAGNLPLSEMVAGSLAWVRPDSHKTLYYVDNDTATGAGCVGNCINVWPIFAPTAGSANIDNMTIITRSDGNGKQWAYQGRPLYTYVGDTGPDQANGVYGPWHISRPASGATPPPGGGICHGYC